MTRGDSDISGGHPEDATAGRHVPDDDASGSDKGSVADANFGNNAGVRRQKYALS